MEQIDANRVAETILAAPGWVRLGITAPAAHVREDAAQELAKVILNEIAFSTTRSADARQETLSL